LEARGMKEECAVAREIDSDLRLRDGRHRGPGGGCHLRALRRGILQACGGMRRPGPILDVQLRQGREPGEAALLENTHVSDLDRVIRQPCREQAHIAVHLILIKPYGTTHPRLLRPHGPRSSAAHTADRGDRRSGATPWLEE